VLDPFQLGGGVVGGLVLDGGDVLAEGFLLGLDDADRLAIDEEDVVGGAGVGGVFADGLAGPSLKLDGVFVLNGPSRIFKPGAGSCASMAVAGDLLGILVGDSLSVVLRAVDEAVREGKSA
jgi:hypothetical protein